MKVHIALPLKISNHCGYMVIDSDRRIIATCDNAATAQELTMLIDRFQQVYDHARAVASSTEEFNTLTRIMRGDG